MYELPQNDLLSSDLENEKVLVKSQNWVPNFPSRKKNLPMELENCIKLAIEISMKDGRHFSKSFISLKVFCEWL